MRETCLMLKALRELLAIKSEKLETTVPILIIDADVNVEVDVPL